MNIEWLSNGLIVVCSLCAMYEAWKDKWRGALLFFGLAVVAVLLDGIVAAVG
jgi:phosphatidylserine synthase